MSDKPQLHQSMIGMIYRCPEQFRRRYGARFGWNDREEIIPPGVNLIVGSATHKSVEKNLSSKIETGELLPIEQIRDIAHDEAAGAWQQEVRLVDEEMVNPEQTKGDCIDMAVTLSALHALVLAPIIPVKSVERKWVVTLNDFPFDLGGTWDIEETTGAIRDTKTSAKSPSADAADTSEQLTMYSLAKRVCDKEEAPALYLDYLVKTKTPKVVIQQTTRSEFQQMVMLRRIERAAEIIEKGAFMPANPSEWICSRKWCGYSNTCKFYSGK